MEAFRPRFSDGTGLKDQDDPDDPDAMDDLDCLDKVGTPFTIKEETVFVKVEWDSSTTDPARNDPLSARLEAAGPMKLESESSIQSDSCGIYNCDQCNFSSGAKKDLKRHLESVHHVIFTSDNEAKIAAAKSRGIHAEVGTDGRLHYHCTYCDYKSVRNDTIKSHIDRKHLGVKPYSPTKPHHKKDKVCLQCDYTTDQSKHLTRHMEASHGEQPSREVVFARLNEAEAHGVIAEEQEGGGISYSCDICGHRYF